MKYTIGLAFVLLVVVAFGTPDPYALRQNDNNTSGYNTTSSQVTAPGYTNLYVPGQAQIGTAGAGTPGSRIIMSSTNGTYHLTLAPSDSQSSDIFWVYPTDPFTGLLKSTATGTNVTISRAVPGTDYSTTGVDFDVTGSTTNATATPIWTNTLADLKMGSFEAQIEGGGPTNRVGMKRFAAFYRSGGGATLIGSNNLATIQTGSGMDAYFTASGNNVVLNVVGKASENVNWEAKGFYTVVANGNPASSCTTVTDQSSGAGVTQSLGDSNGHMFVATKFTASANYSTCKAEFDLKKNNSPSGAITAYIWASDGGGGVPGTLLGTAVGTIDSSTLTSSFAFYGATGLSVSLNSGTAYYIGLSYGGTINGSSYAIWQGQSGTLTYASTTVSGTWNFIGNTTLNFKIYQ